MGEITLLFDSNNSFSKLGRTWFEISSISISFFRYDARSSSVGQGSQHWSEQPPRGFGSRANFLVGTRPVLQIDKVLPVEDGTYRCRYYSTLNQARRNAGKVVVWFLLTVRCSAFAMVVWFWCKCSSGMVSVYVLCQTGNSACFVRCPDRSLLNWI